MPELHMVKAKYGEDWTPPFTCCAQDMIGLYHHRAGLSSAVGSASADPGGRKFKPQQGHITFVEIDHEIISTAILPLLIQEGQLSQVSYW